MNKKIFVLTFAVMTVLQGCAGGTQGIAGAIQYGLTAKQKDVPTNEWGDVSYNTQLSVGLKSAEREYKTNQIVELLVRIRNLSTNEEYGVDVQRSFLLNEDFLFVVISPSGKDVSPVFHGSPRFSGSVVWVHPNQIDGFGFALSEICKTDEVGTYQIIMKMKRATPDRRKSFEIISNPLYVSIVSDK